MNAVVVDKRQLDGEVKERNKFYRALIQIQIIAKNEDPNPELQLRTITGLCQESLKRYQCKKRKDHASN